MTDCTTCTSMGFCTGPGAREYKGECALYRPIALLTSIHKTSTAETPSTTTSPALGRSLDEAKKIITGERQDQYGNPEDSFGIIADYWTTYLKHRFGCVDIKLSPLDTANLMVLFKQARKLGQQHKRDNFIDAIGYEAIAADLLTGQEA